MAGGVETTEDAMDAIGVGLLILMGLNVVACLAATAAPVALGCLAVAARGTPPGGHVSDHCG